MRASSPRTRRNEAGIPHGERGSGKPAPIVANDHWRIVSFTVDGPPVAKGRPKFTTRGGFARSYTPQKTRAYEDLIRCAALEAMGGKDLLEGHLTMTVTAYVAMPKAFSKLKRADAIDGLIRPTTRPDADNIAKAALDGCNSILFRDDAQVTDLIVRKRYSAQPRLTITVETGEDFA